VPAESRQFPRSSQRGFSVGTADSLRAAFIGGAIRFGAGGPTHDRGCSLGGILTKCEPCCRRNLNPCAVLVVGHNSNCRQPESVSQRFGERMWPARRSLVRRLGLADIAADSSVSGGIRWERTHSCLRYSSRAQARKPSRQARVPTLPSDLLPEPHGAPTSSRRSPEAEPKKPFPDTGGVERGAN